MERALVEDDAFALVDDAFALVDDAFARVEVGLRVRLALPFELVRELDRFAEPPLLGLEDPLDEPFRLGVFLRVFVVVWAISVSLGGCCARRDYAQPAGPGPAYGRVP